MILSVAVIIITRSVKVSGLIYSEKKNVSKTIDHKINLQDLLRTFEKLPTIPKEVSIKAFSLSTLNIEGALSIPVIVLRTSNPKLVNFFRKILLSNTQSVSRM